MTTATASSKPTMIIVTAILSIILAIFNLCGGIAAITGGAILGGLGAAVNQAALEAGDEVAAGQAAAALGALGGGLFALFGLVFLVLGIALLVDAIGLFQGKPWSWMLTLVLYGIYVVFTVVGWLLNNSFSVVSLVLVAIAGVILYMFYTNADIKRALGKL